MKNLLLTLLLTTFVFNSIQAQSIQKVKLYNPPDITPVMFNQYVEFNGKLFFASLSSLFVTDGTESGTQLIKSFPSGNINNIYSLTVLNNKLIFTAYDSSTGWELWVSDGTPNGTNILVDINPGAYNGVWDQYSSRVLKNIESPFPQINGNIFFYGNDGTHGIELWKSDGTAQGTSMVKDINLKPGVGMADSPYIRTIVKNDNKLIFFATDTTYGDEIWISDGTETGTQLIKELAPGNMHGITGGEYYLNYDNKVLFTIGLSLYITDGTPTNTKIISSNTYIQSNDFAYFNNKLYFFGAQISSGSGVYETDGTTSGTKELIKITKPRNNKNKKDIGLALLSNRLYFVGEDTAKKTGIWSSDGTIQGTQLEYSADESPYNMTLINDKFYFKQYDRISMFVNVWYYKGSGTSPQMVPHSFTNYSTNGSQILKQLISVSNFATFGNQIFFMHRFDDPGGTTGLYRVGMWPDNVNDINNTSEISIYPNPTTDQVTIKGDNITRITISDISGSIIYKQTTSTANTTINTGSWSCGLYMVAIHLSDGSTAYRKIIK